MKFRTQFDPSYQGIWNPVLDKEILTVPDMSIPLKQLLINHSRGINTAVQTYQGEYFEETEIPVINDLVDLQEYAETLIEEKQKIEAELARLKDEKKKDDTNLRGNTENGSEGPDSIERAKSGNPMEDNPKGT